MSMEEHRGTSLHLDEEDTSTSISLGEVNKAIREAEGEAAAAPVAEDDDDDTANSADNVIPREKLVNGLNALTSIWGATVSSARRGIAQLQESEAAAKLRESTKPVVAAVVEGAKVAGEKTAAVVEAAKPGLEQAGVKIKAGLTDMGTVLADAAEKSRPALEKAGTAIKTTAIHVAEQAKPTVEKVGSAVTSGVASAGQWVNQTFKGGGKDGGEGGGPQII